MSEVKIKSHKETIFELEYNENLQKISLSWIYFN